MRTTLLTTADYHSLPPSLGCKVKDAEHRLSQVKKAYSRQESLFSELKSSGGGVTELNRESIHK